MDVTTYTDAASTELLAVSFNDNGRAYIGDCSPEDLVSLFKQINAEPSDLEVIDGYLTNVAHPVTVAPSTPCELTYTQVSSHPKRLCESCMQPAFLHRSEGDDL